MTTRQASLALNGTITNFLSLDEQYFETSIGTWTATNASILRNVGFRFKETYHTLEVNPYSSQSIALSVEAKQIPTTLNTDYITFYSFVYCTKRTQFEILLYETASSTTINLQGRLNEPEELPTLGNQEGHAYIVDSESNIYRWYTPLGEDPYWSVVGTTAVETVTANALTWSVIRGPKLNIPPRPQTTTLRMVITADSHAGAKFYIGHPSLVNTLHLVDNVFLRQCMTYIPEVLIEADRNQTLPDFPLLRILDIATMYANRGARQLETFRFRDIASGYKETDNSTKSTLINPDVAETSFLSWLAQIVGVRITQVGGGTTPWGNLPTTWEAFLTAVDNAGDDDDIAEWFEIEGFNVRDANFDASARTQIKTAQTGYRAGQTSTFETVIESIINGNKEYVIYTDPVGLPWTILVRTLVSETPGGVEGEPSEALVNALNSCKPMGFVIDHRCVTAL